MNIKPHPMSKIKKEEWIILRLLYLMMSLDPTMVRVKDVERSINYIDKKYKNIEGFSIVQAFNLLKQEHGKENTFNDIGITLINNLQKQVDVHREYIDEEQKEFMQRRVFGVQYHPQSSKSAIVQDIIDAENMRLGTENGQ